MKLKNKQALAFLIVFILSFVISLFSTTSFANTTEISTYSPRCILMEASTGKIIYEKNAYEKAYPASTTKIMTAILTLEHCDLTDTATVSHDAIFSVPLGYAHAYLVEGEVLTIEQLLHVLLIPSANDAANVIAEHIAGSMSSFTTMMNTKASEIGCLNTHFVNANGIHDENHYSTAYDLALMGRYAMQNDTFRKIVTTTKYTLPATNKYLESNRYFKATNELIVPDDRDSVDNYYYPYTTGIKTGFTNSAANCIVASAKKDDIEYIVVILGAEQTENGLSQRYIDCKNLFNYAFDNYKTEIINQKNSVLKEVKISNTSIFNNHLNLVVEDEIKLLLKKDTNINDITPTIEITSDLVAPISENSVIGTITYDVDGNTYTSNLLAQKEIKESSTITSILTIGSILLVLYLLFKLLKTNNSKKKRKKSKKKTTQRKKDRDNYLYW